MDALILLAAGESRRYGGSVSKVLRHLAGKPVLVRALAPFLVGVDKMMLVIAARREDEAAVKRLLPRARVVEGGASRARSLARAVAALPASGVDTVLVHEAARPLASADVVRRVLRAARRDGAAAPVVPVLDPLHEVVTDAEGVARLEGTLDRSRLGAAQTPVGVRLELLRQALAAADERQDDPPDDVSLLQQGGIPVTAVRGDVANLRIATPADLALAEALLEGTTGAP